MLVLPRQPSPDDGKVLTDIEDAQAFPAGELDFLTGLHFQGLCTYQNIYYTYYFLLIDNQNTGYSLHTRYR